MTTPRRVVDPEQGKRLALRHAEVTLQRFGEADQRVVGAILFAEEHGASPEEIADAIGLPVPTVKEIIGRGPDPSRPPLEAPRRVADPEGDRCRMLDLAKHVVQNHGEARGEATICAARELGASAEEIVEATGLPASTVAELLERKRSRAG